MATRFTSSLMDCNESSCAKPIKNTSLTTVATSFHTIEKLGDLHYCYGISKQVARFPHDLPQAIGQEMGIAAFERRARERIASLPFHRPSEHASKLRELSFIPESFQRI